MDSNVHDLLHSQVEVRWDSKWYGGFLLNIEGDYAEIEFDDGGFPNEFVPLHDIRRIKAVDNDSDSTEAVAIAKAGSFNYESFNTSQC